MGLHNFIQSSCDRNANIQVFNQILLHNGEHSQSSLAHTNNLFIQKNINLVPISLLPHKQKPKQILTQKQQALFHPEPF